MLGAWPLSGPQGHTYTLTPFWPLEINHPDLQTFLHPILTQWAAQEAQWEKNPPASQETWVQSLGQEDPPEKEIATHSSILAWETHGQRSLVGYGSWGRGRVGHDFVTKQPRQFQRPGL